MIRFDRIDSEEKIEEIYRRNTVGRNATSLNAHHHLWTRFNHYKKNPPHVMFKGDEPLSFIFASESAKSKYIVVYGIVTQKEHEGRGYASELWERVMEEAHQRGMERLKISCTPESVTWHNQNGIIFWSVDHHGSLRSDQPLKKDRREQILFRAEAKDKPEIAIPTDSKIIQSIRDEELESHGFGEKKTAKVNAAIAAVGDSWMRPQFMDETEGATLEDFI